MQVFIYSRILKEQDIPYVQILFDALHQHGINAFVFKPYLQALQDKVDLKQDVGSFEGYKDLTQRKIDAFITLGR